MGQSDTYQLFVRKTIILQKCFSSDLLVTKATNTTIFLEPELTTQPSAPRQNMVSYSIIQLSKNTNLIIGNV